jgi:DNA-nicking Smr family endonuclease
MAGSVLRALIDAAQPAGWALAIALVITGIGLVVKNADRLANAVDRWMLACDRRAARKAALAAKGSKGREHALAVLDRLQQERKPVSSRRPDSGSGSSDE